MSQKDVAKTLNASDRNVWRWENIGRVPSSLYMSRILTFIGYIPIDKTTATLGEKLYWARQIAGLTQKEAAREIGISESTLVFTETHGRLTRYTGVKKKLNKFIEKYHSEFEKRIEKNKSKQNLVNIVD